MTEQEYILHKAKTIKLSLLDDQISMIKVVELFSGCLAAQYHKTATPALEKPQQ
ncbi:hypothetical protein [Jeotgalibacillus campisalis]|uniref:Uncharacterized protein n=1 Tax=Jeotgalibacillus campisalis TaxID=220754 RepID=A0A0C2VWT7_9BACL|nr:hypothetical protein [Jeotgalibacillus campisalis]KIL48433.1 hypothetical protein KR50_14690 [Jeotgalibacillus campisalis]